MLYPNTPGFKTIGTSETAACTMERGGKAATLRDTVLSLLKEPPHIMHGLTADEGAEILGESILSIRPRFSELSALGQIVDSGIRRRNASGRSAVVWVANFKNGQTTLF